ncbi:MAG: hypothetical protein B7Z45_05280 [Azorhizobium sp. 12-66-6]|nr:MAG: hypothetical protein B7Z45_05280 [Azorhizobium sp. 12-66-6]
MRSRPESTSPAGPLQRNSPRIHPVFGFGTGLVPHRAESFYHFSQGAGTFFGVCVGLMAAPPDGSASRWLIQGLCLRQHPTAVARGDKFREGIVTQREHLLWKPDAERIARTHVTALIGAVNSKHGQSLASYADLHAWTIANPADFWDMVWDDCAVIGEKGVQHLVDGDKMPGAQFFPDAKLNFAENLLRKRGDETAIVFRGEDKVKKRLSFDELHALTSRIQQALKAEGVGVGDRVAGFMPNMPETIAFMLAASVLTPSFWTFSVLILIWLADAGSSSCSPS